MKKSYLFLLLYLIYSSSYSQSLKEIYHQSTTAYKAQDFVTFLKLTKKLDSLRPSHPTYTYNLACAYALNKDEDKAIKTLQQCILYNAALKIEDEKDFDFIKSSAKFNALLSLKNEYASTLNTAKKIVTLTEKALHPESLLFLEDKKIWLAGSIRKHKIVQFDIKTGKTQDWLSDTGILAVMSMKVDAQQQYLWAATAALPEMEGFEASQEGKSEILKIDIATKKIVQRWSIQEQNVFGDLIITKNNEVFITDSSKPIVFKITHQSLTKWLDLSSEAFNLQGITLDDSQKTLFIADYLKGIIRIDCQNPTKKKWLHIPDNFAYKGIDGLLFYKNSLIAIQNGVKPIRIVQFKLDSNHDITVAKCIENNRIEFNEPTLGLLHNNKLYYIGNAPWNFYNRQGILETDKINFPEIYYNTLK